MRIFWIREDPHTVGDLRGIDGIGNCRNSAGHDLLPERGGGYDLHRLNPPVVLAVRDVHPRLAAVFEIEDDREGQSVVAGRRVRNVRDIQFKHRLGPFDPSSRSKLSRSAQRELDWYEAPWSANALISVLLCASLGRSCRDRAAPNCSTAFSPVSPARARPGKYDLDVGNADKAEDLAKVPLDVSGR